MDYFNKCRDDLDSALIMHLFYDFRLALESEDFEYCGRLKTELERRERLNEIDKDLIAALLHFYGRYSSGDKSVDKENFKEIFQNLLK